MYSSKNNEYISNNINNSNNISINNITIKTTEQTTNILHNFCSNYETNNIHIEYKVFKLLYKCIDYKIILQHIIDVISYVLNNYCTFIIHINLDSLTLLDIDKYKGFIQIMSVNLKESFNDKLDKCFIYDAPYIFNQIFNLLSYFIDKKTQEKIKVLNKVKATSIN